MLKSIKKENALRALKHAMPFCIIVVLLILTTYVYTRHIQEECDRMTCFFQHDLPQTQEE